MFYCYVILAFCLPFSVHSIVHVVSNKTLKESPWQLRQPDHSTGHRAQNGSYWWQTQVDSSKQREVTNAYNLSKHICIVSSSGEQRTDIKGAHELIVVII